MRDAEPRRAECNPQVDVSVLVPVLNEARFIVDTAPVMLAQRFEGEIEFLFLDGGSSDGTKRVLEELGRKDSRVRVLDNPGRFQANALNLGLSQARGEYVARMDAHTFYPSDYIARGVERLRQGDVAWVAGPQIAVQVDRGSGRVALAYRSPLGVGGAKFRRLPAAEIETDTGFTGILRRAALEALQGWDEGWPRNEDIELAARVQEGGGRIVCVPQMAAHYVPRGSLPGLARQYLRYGYYRAKTWCRHPWYFRRSHFLPPGLVLTVLGSLLGRSVAARRCRLTLAGYGICVLAETGRQGRSSGWRDAAFLPLVFATMHLAWGAGFLAGCLRFGPASFGHREAAHTRIG
jgi:succinoglycan biosynthesis protein ExoA